MDTNVLLSGLGSKKGQAYTLLRSLTDNTFKIVISVPLILEYESILLKELDRSLFSVADINAFIDYICRIGIPADIYFLWRPFLKDPYDDHILEAAFSAKCDYIVTYNKRDFYGAEQFGIGVLTPYEFLNLLGGEP